MAKGQQLVSTLLESEPGEWTFSTRVTNDNIEISDHEVGADYRDANVELTVVWEADFDVRAWGIKEILPILRSVTGQITLTNPDTDEVTDRIPVSWPKPATDQHLQVVLGRAPDAQASAKDFASYYGPARGDWEAETETDFRAAGTYAVSLAILGVKISVSERRITVQF